MEPLDNPIWASLTGPHAGLSVGGDRARCYDPEVAVFAGADELSDDVWGDLFAAASPSPAVVLARTHRPEPPAGVTRVFEDPATQWVAPARLVDVPRTDEVVALGDADVEAMLALIATDPHLILSPRTIDLGGYVGVFDADNLIAMAGRRFATETAVEVSAVCVHPDHKRRGLGAATTVVVANRIHDEGRLPFLHTIESNTPARKLYARLGFEVRTTMHFAAFVATT